ncbi:zinc finger MYM-type protein 1 [Artemisia annua]|uniref:Zinc finger MYM-type protein 1 n=1 Tax=Artemisia annua TaxID=35608 RepID=A0A2U1PZ58_ARTAN|nr:zinc finger MYM-type protein 1 [Artemisia annua]
MAHVCVKGKSFFGIIQRIYAIFANSINRWQILKNNVKGWSLKSLSQTRWESCVESVKAIKLQLVDVREALLEVGEKDNDDATASAANSLAEKELGDLEFVVSIVIWYQLLREVNIVSKKLQLKDMHLDIAIKEIHRLIQYFKDYREIGYSKAIEEAKEIASELGIDPIFPQKRLIQRKKQFVIVASAKRSFSQLKLLHSYLRSTMSQERLSGLAMIAIENGILEDINCEELINQFAMKNARRASRIIGIVMLILCNCADHKPALEGLEPSSVRTMLYTPVLLTINMVDHVGLQMNM